LNTVLIGEDPKRGRRAGTWADGRKRCTIASRSQNQRRKYLRSMYQSWVENGRAQGQSGVFLYNGWI